MTEACLTFRDLTLGYNGHPAVHHLNGDGEGRIADRGGRRQRLGQVDPDEGHRRRAEADGRRKPEDARPSIAYLPQQSELDRSFPARVVELVSMGLWPKRGMLGRHTAGRPGVGDEGADGGRAGRFRARPIDTLSGGQLQRALFARVLVQDAEIILLDEPFNAIDAGPSPTSWR